MLNLVLFYENPSSCVCVCSWARFGASAPGIAGEFPDVCFGIAGEAAFGISA